MLVQGVCARDPRAVEAHATWAERVGYDTLCSQEINHDPFLPLVSAIRGTSKIKLGTAITVAFARTPMAMATVTWDLHAMSGGRLQLGLGSQVKAHIERRFSMPWSHPAARMREYILALRAIWATWQTGAPLNFEGEFYQHTLMTPNFDPGPIPGAELPTIYLAGVGPKMIEAAAEVADGLMLHGFTSRLYEEKVTLPVLDKAFAKTGRPREELSVVALPFIVTGVDEESTLASVKWAKSRIAFYASTPAYRGVLEAHGWGDLQDELNEMTKRGEWAQMSDLVTDEMLQAYAVVAEPDRLAATLNERMSGIADTVTIKWPAGFPDDRVAEILAQLKD